MGEHAEERRERRRRDAEVRRFFATASGLELLKYAFHGGSGKEFEAYWKRLTPSERSSPEALELRILEDIRRNRLPEAQRRLNRSPSFNGKVRLQLLLALIGRNVWLDAYEELRPECTLGLRPEDDGLLTANEAFDLAKADREIIRALWEKALIEAALPSSSEKSAVESSIFLREVGRFLCAEDES